MLQPAMQAAGVGGGGWRSQHETTIKSVGLFNIRFILTLFPGGGLPLVLPPLLVQLVQFLDENAARGVCDGRHVVPMLLHVKQPKIIMCTCRRRK
jgi:hypothetical protein